MPDTFFSTSKPKKRKRSDPNAIPINTKKLARTSKDARIKKHSAVNSIGVSRKKTRDEDLSDQSDGGGVDDMDLRVEAVDPGASDDEDETETPAEKRLRLAQLYLDSLKTSLGDGEYDAAEIDREIISSRLKQDVMEQSGKVHSFIADSFDFSTSPRFCMRTRGHRFSITSAVASESGNYLFTSGKEGHIFKWDLRTGKKLGSIYKVKPSIDTKGKGKAAPEADIKGHTDEVLSLAISGDEKVLASSGRDRRLCVWDIETCEWKKTFSGYLGHKDAIANIAFRKGTNQLYTGSLDRTVKVYDLSDSVMGYVETVFGHQDHVVGLDALRGDGCVSVGSRDKTLRYWKIVDGKQVVYRGGGRSRMREVLDGGLKGDDDADPDGLDPTSSKRRLGEGERRFVEGSLECVAMIDEATFLTGGDSGTISLFTSQRRKPIFKQPLAHGLNAETGVIQTPRWITALSALRYSDIFASGSWEGDIRIWKLDPKLKHFSLVGKVPAPGVVNTLQLLMVATSFIEEATWTSALVRSDGALIRQTKALAVAPFLLVAGIGQEPRLGRWVKVKEGGAKNGALVFLFSPRTTLMS